jgi:hypothetical protein
MFSGVAGASQHLTVITLIWIIGELGGFWRGAVINDRNMVWVLKPKSVTTSWLFGLVVNLYEIYGLRNLFLLVPACK